MGILSQIDVFYLLLAYTYNKEAIFEIKEFQHYLNTMNVNKKFKRWILKRVLQIARVGKATKDISLAEMLVEETFQNFKDIDINSLKKFVKTIILERNITEELLSLSAIILS